MNSGLPASENQTSYVLTHRLRDKNGCADFERAGCMFAGCDTFQADGRFA